MLHRLNRCDESPGFSPGLVRSSPGRAGSWSARPHAPAMGSRVLGMPRRALARETRPAPGPRRRARELEGSQQPQRVLTGGQLWAGGPGSQRRKALQARGETELLSRRREAGGTASPGVARRQASCPQGVGGIKSRVDVPWGTWPWLRAPNAHACLPLPPSRDHRPGPTFPRQLADPKINPPRGPFVVSRQARELLSALSRSQTHKSRSPVWPQSAPSLPRQATTLPVQKGTQGSSPNSPFPTL